MPFAEDPAQLSKSRLKSDLVAHNVALPPAASRREVYLELHLKHVGQTRAAAADFSSDEEDPVSEVAEDDPRDSEVLDPSSLTDDDLKATLLKHGVKAGPIVASTRAVYERKLRNLRQSAGEELNGAENTVLYSDSEEEQEEEEEENGNEEDKESDSEQEEEETVKKTEGAQLESSKAETHNPNRAFFYPQCFALSSRLRAPACTKKEPSSIRNSRNALKSSEASRSTRSRIPVGISRASSVDQRSGLGSAMESRSSLSTSAEAERELNGSNVQENWSRSNRLEKPAVEKYRTRTQSLYYTPQDFSCRSRTKEPVKDVLKEIFPAANTTPTGIYATCRKPIKGAAQRPVQYAYPDTPLSPTTLERRQVERRLVPVKIQILVFLFLACILYLIYLHVEDSSSVMDLLDSLTPAFDGGDGELQTEPQNAQADFGQD